MYIVQRIPIAYRYNICKFKNIIGPVFKYYNF